MMRIWKLTPIDLSNPIWRLWNPEPIFVRAETEAQARDLAESKTTKGHPPDGKLLPLNPWGKHKLLDDPAPLPTLCEDVTDQTTEYSIDGPAEVLRHGEWF